MKTSRKLIATLAALSLAAGIAFMTGCSCSAQREVNMNPDEAQRYELDEIGGKQVQVVESGFTIDVGEPLEGVVPTSATVDYAFVVENNNSGYAAQNIPFTATGYAADGSVVFTGGANCQYIYPGIQTAATGSATIALTDGVVPEVDRFEVLPVADVIDWMAIGMTDDEVAGLFQVSNESAEEGPDGVTVKATITGNIHDGDKIFSTTILQDTLEGHAVTLFYDADGGIVFGSGSTNIILDEASEIMAGLEGSNENYDVTLEGVPPYSSFKVFVMPGL